MNDTVVFLGPSLPIADARALIDAEFRPPAQRGDVARLEGTAVRRIVLIDGIFHGAPSVWQRELLSALRRGVEVRGASSMGALRAAELERYGMHGHGRVFEWYRDAVIFGDDEVALLHGDASQGWRPISEPLVNIRATLERAQERGLLTAVEVTRLAEEAKRTFYPQRSLRALVEGLLLNDWPEARRRAVGEGLIAMRVDQKRADAVDILSFCATTPIGAPSVSPRDESTTRVCGLAYVPATTATRSLDGKKGHHRGTHRAVAPEETLRRIAPHLARWGITRLADVTALDRIGIPTYCAIRPAATTLQVSNGKGLRHVDAQVSALMEAMELAHMEVDPPLPLISASIEQMATRGERYSFPARHGASGQPSPHDPIEWIRGVDLGTQSPVWLPAMAAWMRPGHAISSHGLASGNTLVEAALHALYEIVERHLLSGFVQGGEVDLSSAQIFAAEESEDEDLRELARRVGDADLGLVVLRVDAPMRVHAFMAVLMDPDPLSGATTVNVGYGAHLSPSVAASRAITEAAQSRLTFIHGAREDLRPESYQRSEVQDRLLEFFSSFEPDSEWSSLADHAQLDLDADLAVVLGTLRESGLPDAFCVDMSSPGAPFAVTKVLVPGTLVTIPI